MSDKSTGTRQANLERIPSGVPGLDEVLRGGLFRGRTYLVQGEAGTGKTLFGFHFLQEGVERGASTLMIHLEEREDDLRANAQSIGIDLDDVEIMSLGPGAESFLEGETYDVFSPVEVEASEVAQSLADAIDRIDPDRVVLDPASHLRQLSTDVHQYRKRLIALKHYIQDAGATLLLVSPPEHEQADEALQYLSDGCIRLEHLDWGRQIRVPKFRGSGTSPGAHDMTITDQGIQVHPILVPEEHGRPFEPDPVPSGVEGLDRMLHGGIERGTVTIVAGPTGSGKTTTATQFAKEAALAGERATVYLFEESYDTFRHRNEAIGAPISELKDEGMLGVEVVEPMLRSADEFAQRVLREVEQRGTRVVVIDATRGYTMSLRGEDLDIARRLHGLCRYLRNMGVTTILVDETADVVGSFQPTSERLSYLADNIVFLRHVEMQGELRKVVGVLKKRVTEVEPAIRELAITSDGVQVGAKLENLEGVLTGVPRARNPGSVGD